MRRVFEKWYVDVGQKIQIDQVYVHIHNTHMPMARQICNIYVCIYIYVVYYFRKEQGRILNIEYCYCGFTKQSFVVFITTHINGDHMPVGSSTHRHSGSLFVGSVAAMNSMEPFQQQACPRSQRLEKEI